MKILISLFNLTCVILTTENRYQTKGAEMLHDLRSLQTYPPPAYPIYELHFRAKDEIPIAEAVEELEGHRTPLFYIKTISEEEQEVLVIFKKPFQEEEKWLLDHLYQVIQDRLSKEEIMGQDN